MEKLGDITGIAALGILAWQDFRVRRIAWWLLPVLAAAVLTAAFSRHSAAEIGRAFSFNIVFLLLQFVLLWIWFSLRQKKPASLIDTQIGLGDVLFMICLALVFSPANFLLFYTVGMVLTLLLSLLARVVSNGTRKEIPLAGALALPLMLLCCWRLIDPAKDFYSDDWLLQLLNTGF